MSMALLCGALSGCWLLNDDPVAGFTATPPSGPAPLSVTLDASASFDVDGRIDRYEWTFGDGQSGVGQVVTHTYATEGTYTVWLTVTDDDGAMDSLQRTIVVTAPNEPDQWEVICWNISEVILGLDTIEGSTRVFAVDAASGDVMVYGFVPMDWAKAGGPGAQFVVGNTGTLYGLNSSGSIWKRVSGQQWTWMRGNVSTIVGSPGSLYAVDAPTGDIYSHDWVSDTWTRVGGPGTEFVAGSGGRLYALAMDGSTVFRYEGSPGQWTHIGGGFRTLVAGGSKLYGIQAGSGDVYEFSGTPLDWTRVGGPGKAHVADDNGQLYGLTVDGAAVYRYSGSPLQWSRIEGGPAIKIAAGGDSVCTIDANNTLRMYTPST